jgi:hypothetical protein
MDPMTQLPMTPYRNRSGGSGIAAYAVLDEDIVVEFTDGSRVRYGASRPGRHHVGQMKSLAMSGRGLGKYIDRYVREKYEERL